MVVASNCSGPFVKTGIPKDRRPTAVGVVREDGSITMSVDGRGWSLPVSTLCTVLNSSTDKFVLVSLHLGSPPEAVGEASLLDLVKFSAVRSIHRRSGKEEQMTSHAAVHMVAQRTANTTEQGTAHTAEAPATRRVVGRGRARSAIACGFCLVLRLSLLVTSSHGGTSAFAFLVAWFPSRW